MASYEQHHHSKGRKRVSILDPAHNFIQKVTHLEHHSKRQSLPDFPHHRVSKAKTVKSDRHTKTSINVMNFEKQMSEYTANLANEFEQNLNETEQKLEESLVDLTDQLHNKCKILEKADKVLHSRLGDERLVIQDPKDPSRSHERSLNDLMQAFSAQVTESNKILDDRWSEWNKVQRQILCLAIEIYGEQVVTTDNAEISETFQEEMAAAVSRHEIVQEQYESAYEALANTEREMETLADNTKNSIDAQLKEIVLGQDKKKEAVRKAMQALSED